MKLTALFIIGFLMTSSTYCQVNAQQQTYLKPDYNQIKNDIQDSSSVFYYPKLMTRLTAMDTTLNIEEYRHLYYGYIFQKEYQPYWISPDEEKLVEFYKSKKIRERDYGKIIQLATHSITEFPFDLRQMNFLAYTYHLKGDEEMAKKVSYRFQGSFHAIMSSGDGRTCESGYHVISVSHEYVFMNMFQFNMSSQALQGNCDYLKFEKNENNIEGVYFNIGQMFDKNLEILNEKK